MALISGLRALVLLGVGAVVVVSCGSDDQAKSAPDADAGAAGETPGAAGLPDGSGGGNQQPDAHGGAGGLALAGTSSGGGGASFAGAGGAALAGAGGTEPVGLGGSGGVVESASGSAGVGVIEQPLSCEELHPAQPPTKPTLVRLVNNTSGNIYLGSPAATCQYQFGFQVFQGQTELQPSRDTCELTCGELQDSGCDCGSVCVSIVTLVAPTKHYDIGWPGTVFTAATLPAQCLPATGCEQVATPCLLEQAAPAGPLDIRATAYPSKECDSGQCFDCTAGASGSCIVQGASRTTGTPLHANAAWTDSGTLQLTFVDP